MQSNATFKQSQAGFSLIELMIALALGLVISGAVIQVMVSSRVTQGVNQAVTSVQELSLIHI